MNAVIDKRMHDVFSINELSNMSEEFKEYEEVILKQSEKELLELINIDEDPFWVQNLSFEQLTKLTFFKAHDVINQLSIKKRISLLNDLDRHLLYLYESTTTYDIKTDADSKMTVKDFAKIMGKIKHLEILQSWLFGIE